MKAFQILKSFPVDEVVDLVDDLLDGGSTEDEAIEAVAVFLDRLIDAGVWIPGPVGIAIEAIDGPLIRAVISLVVALSADPERREARKARRSERRAARQARRAERRQRRSGGGS